MTPPPTADHMSHPVLSPCYSIYWSQWSSLAVSITVLSDLPLLFNHWFQLTHMFTSDPRNIPLLFQFFCLEFSDQLSFSIARISLSHFTFDRSFGFLWFTSCVGGANQKLWFCCEQTKHIVLVSSYTCCSLTYKRWVVHCNLKKLLRVLGSSVVKERRKN